MPNSIWNASSIYYCNDDNDDEDGYDKNYDDADDDNFANDDAISESSK